MIPIDTERLRLRELVDDDAGFIERLVNDPSWLKYIGDRQVHSRNDALRYIHDGPAASFSRHGFGLCHVSLREDGTAIGLCGLLQRDALAHPDIGFAYLPEFRGKGYATEAAGAMLEHARHALRLPRVLAITRPDNHASMRVLLRLGLHLAGKVVLHPNTPGDNLFAIDLATPEGAHGA